MNLLERLRERLDNGLLPPGRVLVCTPFGIHELEALLAVAEAAKQVARYAPDPDWEPGLAQDMPALLTALAPLTTEDATNVSGSESTGAGPAEDAEGSFRPRPRMYTGLSHCVRQWLSETKDGWES